MEIILVVAGALLALIGAGGLIFKKRQPKPEPLNEEQIEKQRERAVEELSDNPSELKRRAQRTIDRLRSRREDK